MREVLSMATEIHGKRINVEENARCKDHERFKTSCRFLTQLTVMAGYRMISDRYQGRCKILYYSLQNSLVKHII